MFEHFSSSSLFPAEWGQGALPSLVNAISCMEVLSDFLCLSLPLGSSIYLHP